MVTILKMSKDDVKNNKKSINHNKSQHNNSESQSHEESGQCKAPLSMKFSPLSNHGRTQPNYLHFAPYGTSKPSSNTLKNTINQE